MRLGRPPGLRNQLRADDARGMGRQFRNGQRNMLGIYETTFNTWPKGTRIHNRPMSAFGGKADIIQGKADIKKCPLMTQSEHWPGPASEVGCVPLPTRRLLVI